MEKDSLKSNWIRRIRKQHRILEPIQLKSFDLVQKISNFRGSVCYFKTHIPGMEFDVVKTHIGVNEVDSIGHSTTQNFKRRRGSWTSSDHFHQYSWPRI